MQNENEGWGNHSYSGLGVNQDGQIFYCFSSGCSCRGNCGMNEAPHGHNNTLKKFEVDGQAFDLKSINGSTLNFDAIQVEFSDY